MPRLHASHLTLRALIITLLIAFGFYLLAELGLLRTGLEGDKSYISCLILAVYLGATLHWLWLAHGLSGDRRRMVSLEVATVASQLPGVAGQLPVVSLEVTTSGSPQTWCARPSDAPEEGAQNSRIGNGPTQQKLYRKYGAQITERQ